MGSAFANGAQFTQCGICQTIIHANTAGVCAECLKEDQKLFDEARKKINFNQHLSIIELCERTGLPNKVIQRWADSGRFRVNHALPRRPDRA